MIGVALAVFLPRSGNEAAGTASNAAPSELAVLGKRFEAGMREGNWTVALAAAQSFAVRYPDSEKGRQAAAIPGLMAQVEAAAKRGTP